jgi:hypothetical protein
MIRTFRPEDIPDGATLRSPYPLKLSPHYRDIWEEWHAWFFSTGRFPTTEEQQRITSIDYPYLGAVGWPACDRRRLWDMTSWAAVPVEADKDFEASSRRSGQDDDETRRKMLSATAGYFQSGRIGAAEPHWGPLIAEVWRSFSEYVRPRMMQRLAEECVRYVEACQVTDEYLAAHGERTEVQDYLEVRYHSVAHRIDHITISISLGIDLEDVFDDSALKAIVDSDMRRTIIAQDFLSLRKEVAAAGDHLENLVLVIARRRGCSLAEALAITSDMFFEEIRHFDRLTDEITRTPLGRLPEVSLFIQGLNDFSAGFMAWTEGSCRYTLKDTCPWWATLPRTKAPPG